MRNRLLALEHKLHGPPGKPRKHRSKRRHGLPRRGGRPRAAWHRTRLRTQAFDSDEPIELTYSSESDSYVASSIPYAAASDYDDEEYDSADAYEASAYAWDEDDEDDEEASAYAWDEDDDEAEAKEVESFDPNEDSHAFSAVDLDEETLAEDLDFSDLDAALDRDEPSRAMSESDFAADLQAILSGKKTYDRVRGGMVSTERDEDNWAAAASVEQPTATPPAEPPEAEANPHDVFSRMSQHMPHNLMGTAPLAQASQTTEAEPTPHEVFDRMGHNMTYANSFDLGTISLEQRFDEFDELLDKEQQTKHANGSGQPVSTPKALDEVALAEDLEFMQAAMGGDEEAEMSQPADANPAPEKHQPNGDEAHNEPKNEQDNKYQEERHNEE